MFKKLFALLQQMGKALMLPVSVLPVAGLLLGIGSAKFSKPEAFGWLPESVATIMKNSGDSIFANLPVIFAIAVTIAFTGNDGASALAAIVGFAVFVAALGAAAQTFFGYVTPQSLIAKGIDPGSLTGLSPQDMVAKGLPETLHVLKPVLGINTLDTGVFGGLLVGCLAAYLFNKFYRIQLPQYLGFFAGKRAVPIITGISAMALGVLMSVIWPPIGNAIDSAANTAAAGSNTAITAATYGIVERSLLPFGLHHIWNVPFFFQIGSFTDPTGRVVHGDIARFFAGDKTAGILGGAYWFKMFGLPGAAIAMWRAAYPKNRGRVSGLMLSAAFTSFLTGITEPLEFSFMFVAPQLYMVHAVIAGFCQWLFQTLGGKMGFTFSQGFIDFALFSTLGTKPWLILAFGPLFFALYYVIFYFGVKALNLKTPGREDEVEGEESTEAVTLTGGAAEMSRELVRAFGGRGNIDVLDACITRLRITVKDMSKVSKARLKALGASGVLEVGNSAQAIFGPRSENLKTDMIEYLKTAGPEADEAYTMASVEPVAAVPVVGSANGGAPEVDPDAPAKVKGIISALGGSGNIRKVDSVALTRLRVEVADSAAVDEAALKASGVQAVLRLPGGKLHLIIGLGADQYATEMKGQVARV